MGRLGLQWPETRRAQVNLRSALSPDQHQDYPLVRLDTKSVSSFPNNLFTSIKTEISRIYLYVLDNWFLIFTKENQNEFATFFYEALHVLRI